MREQSVSPAHVEDAPASKQPAHPSGHLPRLVQLLARQTAGMTHATSKAIEQRGPPKPLQVTIGKPYFGREGKRQAYSVRRRRDTRKSHPSDVTPAHCGGNEPRHEEIAMEEKLRPLFVQITRARHAPWLRGNPAPPDSVRS